VTVAPEDAVADAATARLGRKAASLAVANAIDYALQFLLPVVLVRFLAPPEFGKYRLLWLVAGTVMAVVTQAMAGSLYYFLPRSDPIARRLHINQTLLYLAGCGLLGAFAVSALDPWIPDTVRTLSDERLFVPAFVFLWVGASLLDLIGAAEERVRWQAHVVVALSLVRTVTLGAAAVLTRRFDMVLLALLGFAAFKAGLLVIYVAHFHGLRGPFVRRDAFRDQLRQSLPFAIAGALYGLRSQADQWVASALFPLETFALLSIAALLGPLVNVCRQSALQAFLPRVSRLQAAGDVEGMLRLNGRANVLVAAVVLPLLAYAFAFSDDLITFVYTAAYAAAATAMRIYIAGLIALVLELSTIMLLLRQGAFSVLISAIALLVSIPISWAAARTAGIAGAAAGSVVAIYLEHAATLWRIARRTGIGLSYVQDWRSLGLLLCCAAVAGLSAWVTVTEVVNISLVVVRLGVGAAVLGTVYAGLVAACGLGSELRIALNRAEPVPAS
jgi:O-antigen/teichoic acid export membrane protein